LAIAYIDLAVVSTESGTCVFLQNCWYMMSPTATVNDITVDDKIVCMVLV
jgi:hypothetical protein